MTSLLTEGLVARGHRVTLFGTGDSTTRATLHSTIPHGYWHDETMWPWEMFEMMNMAAAVERSTEFDLIHYQAMSWPLSLPFTRLSSAPVVQTVHHSPGESEVQAWARYPDAGFIAISAEQARRLIGVNVVGTILHGIDTERFRFREWPDDYLLFLGRLTAGKGVLQAIEVARRAGLRLVLAAPMDQYYRDQVEAHVDGTTVVYQGEVDFATKVALCGGARALLYPVQDPEPFGLVMIEAMACGTPVAAFNRGAVGEIVENGLNGFVFDDVDSMAAGLPRVLALDRRSVHRCARDRFGVDRMVDEYISVYRRVVEQHRARARP